MPSADASSVSIAQGAVRLDSDDSPLIWTIPESVLVVEAWTTAAFSTRILHGPEDVRLESNQLLFVPVEKGEWLQVAAGANDPSLQLGLAAGSAAVPDCISWQAPGLTRIRVPNWSRARYVAIRTPTRATLSVRVSARGNAAVEWFLWDTAVADALRRGTPLPSKLPRDAKRILEVMTELRRGLPDAERGRAIAPLLEFWLEEALRIRPLSKPFLKFSEPTDSATALVLTGPTRRAFRHPGADVHRWQLRAWGAARLMIREDGQIARVIDWSPAAAEATTWSDQQQVRTVTRSLEGSAEVEVESGTVALSVEAASYRPQYLEALGIKIRDRGRLSAEADSVRRDWAKQLDPPRNGGNRDATPSSQRDNAVSPARDDAPLLTTYQQYLASQRATDRELAIAKALSGLRTARTAPWQALLTQRLLDLGVADEPLAQRDRDATHDRDAQHDHDAQHDRDRDATRDRDAPTSASLQHSTANENALATRAARELLAPVRLGRRPTLGGSLEAASGGAVDDALLTRLGTKYWEAFPFRSVPFPPGTASRIAMVPVAQRGQCNPARDGEEAWLLPPVGETDFEVELDAGTYAIATLRPIDDEPTPEGFVYIDGTAIAIHSAAGLSSRVALANGLHRIRRLPNSPRFALESTLGMTLPCDRTVRWQRYARLAVDRDWRLDLPAPGAATVARLRLEAPKTAIRLNITTGRQRFEMWVRPDSKGPIEFPIGADDTTIGIRPSSDVDISVAIRRELDALRAPVTLPLAAPWPKAPGAEVTPRADPRLLDEIAELGRELRRRSDEHEMTELRDARARRLSSAGFTSLAARDWLAPPTADDSSSDLVKFEGTTAHILPIGLATTIGPLPIPKDSAGLRARRGAFEQADLPTCARDLEAIAASRVDAETLLAAHCAERAGLPYASGILLEQIGRQSRHGQAALHAASLLADAASHTGDKRLTMQAAVLGAWASNFGAEPSALRGRLARALKWVPVTVLPGASGVAWLAHGIGSSRTDRQRVLSSLVDAPSHALVVAEDEAAELLIEERGDSPLEVNWQCDAALHESPCTLSVWLDGAIATCIAGSDTHHVTKGCRLPLAAGMHRIRLGFDGIASLGWVEARLRGQVLEPTVVSSWSVLEPPNEVRLTVKGPTVLRLQSRTRTEMGGTLSVSGCNVDEPFAALALLSERDSEQRSWPNPTADARVGAVLESTIPIDVDGRCELRIVTRQPDTLVRLDVARSVGVPPPRLGEVRPPDTVRAVTSNADPVTTEDSAEILPRYHEGGIPLLVSARARFVSESLAVALEQDTATSEGAFQDVFGETSVLALRELVAHRLWGTLQSGVRFRNGPSTEFARLSLDLPPVARLPGVDLSGSVYSQRIGAARTTTFSSTAKLSELWPLTTSANLIAQVGYTTLNLGNTPPVAKGIDGDVYSKFYETHPRYASLSTAVALRPFVDTLVNLSVSTRSLPGLDGVDRLTGTAELLVLPVARWPLLAGVDWMSSYRPASALRHEAFVRHDLGLAFSLWNWITPSERLRCFGRMDLFFDAPSANLGNVIWAPSIGLEISASGLRGLRDMSPQQAPFKEFQERGSARTRTGRVGDLVRSLSPEASP